MSSRSKRTLEGTDYLCVGIVTNCNDAALLLDPTTPMPPRVIAPKTRRRARPPATSHQDSHYCHRRRRRHRLLAPAASSTSTMLVHLRYSPPTPPARHWMARANSSSSQRLTCPRLGRALQKSFDTPRLGGSKQRACYVTMPVRTSPQPCSLRACPGPRKPGVCPSVCASGQRASVASLCLSSQISLAPGSACGRHATHACNTGRPTSRHFLQPLPQHFQAKGAGGLLDWGLRSDAAAWRLRHLNLHPTL